MKPLETPILFIIFNRYETELEVFEAIKAQRPKQLFIAADGPRLNRNEEEACKLARQVVDHIDWDCEVKTLFRSENLGCRKAVSGAISWFFEQVPEGIILEDDCVPHASFFEFCSVMLERYREEKRIMGISGVNWQRGRRRGDGAYYYSSFPGIWGWATWADRWDLYDAELEGLPDYIDLGRIKEVSDIPEVQHYMLDKFQSAYEKDSWGYIWNFTMFDHRGLCVIANKNLISNIGFGDSATHTTGTNQERMHQPVDALDNFNAPSEIQPHRQADHFLMTQLLCLSRYKMVRMIKRPLRYLKSWLIYWRATVLGQLLGPRGSDYYLLTREMRIGRWSKMGKHVFITSFPKSASTYLFNVMASLTGYEKVLFIQNYDANEQDVYRPKFLDYLGSNTVSYQHARATDTTLELLKLANVKPVILVRNLADCIVSLRDHMYNEPHNVWWPMANITRDFYALDKVTQYHYLIDHFVPWYLNFYTGWQDVSRKRILPCYWLTYEDLVGQPENEIQKLQHWFGLENKNLDATGQSNEGGRFNVGKSGRGKEELNRDHLDKIANFARYYPDHDLSMIGL